MFKVEDNQAAETAENKNRRAYDYPLYKPSVQNIPALQNYMFHGEGAIIQIKNYSSHKKLMITNPSDNFQE